MSLFWLRVALALYALGLLHAFITVVGRRAQTFGVALGAISLGAVLHLVSIVESGLAGHQFPVTSFPEAVSALAFLIALVFLAIYWRYRLEALCVFVFPLVFMLTLAAAFSNEPTNDGPILRSVWWLPLHASMFFLGHTLLFLTSVASLMYLLQERELKSKKPRGFYYRLPPLSVLDDLAKKTLAAGFPLVTIAICIGAFFASQRMGRDWPLDPRVAWSFVTWLIYLGLIFFRWTAGWRGRKAAYLAIVGFASVIVSWGVSSNLHGFMNR
jgi:ABC-type transport system involved in cytochrome c biogenesis permease subunit